MGKLVSLMMSLEMDKKKFIKMHVICFIPSIIYAIASVFYPNFIGLVVDEGISENNLKITFWYSALMILVGLITVLSEYISSILYDKFYLELTHEMKSKLYIKFMNAENRFYTSVKTGDMYTCLSRDVSNIIMLVTKELPNIATNLIIFIGASVFIIYYYRFSGILIICGGAIFVFLQRRIGKMVQNSSEKTRMAVGREASFSMETLSNLETIQMLGYIDIMHKKFTGYSKNSQEECLKHDEMLYKSFSLSFLFNMIIMVSVLLIGAFQVKDGYVDVGVLFSVVLYSEKVISPMKTLARLYVDAKDIVPMIEKVCKLVGQAKTREEATIELGKGITSIEYRNVQFSYESFSKKVYDDMNLKIAKGDIIGIVGGNGTGKTTLIKLLFKLLSSNSGEIIVNEDINIKDVDRRAIHEHISYMPQEVFLESGEIRDIVNPLKRNINNQEIIALFKALNLDFKVFNCSLEFDIAENANNISGGEKQKLALARLVLENKEWIIMDEPTSAIDFESELRVCDFLREYLIDKTAVIITHRTALLELCNKKLDLGKKE